MDLGTKPPTLSFQLGRQTKPSENIGFILMFNSKLCIQIQNKVLTTFSSLQRSTTLPWSNLLALVKTDHYYQMNQFKTTIPRSSPIRLSAVVSVNQSAQNSLSAIFTAGLLFLWDLREFQPVNNFCDNRIREKYILSTRWLLTFWHECNS